MSKNKGKQVNIEMDNLKPNVIVNEEERPFLESLEEGSEKSEEATAGNYQYLTY